MKQLFVFTSLLLLSCIGRESAPVRRIPPVKSAIAQDNTFIVKDFVGLSTPDESVNLAFKVSGQLLSVPATKGVEVAKDELLAEIDPRDFELQLLADQSSYEQAKSKFERTERLLSHQAVSRQEYEGAKSEFIRAKSIYENSKTTLAETKLRAPFRSVVERVYVDAYQRVSSGERIVKVVSPISTTVEFTLPESSLAALADTTTLFEVRFDSYEGVVFGAHIKDYARTMSDASGFPVSLTIESQSAYPIQSGMSCTITMMVAQDNPSSVRLPLSAIYAPAVGGDYVWVIGEDDIVRLNQVVLGEVVGSDQIVVNSGVAVGDRVVTAGVYQLRDGDVVRVLDAGL